MTRSYCKRCDRVTDHYVYSIGRQVCSVCEIRRTQRWYLENQDAILTRRRDRYRLAKQAGA